MANIVEDRPKEDTSVTWWLNEVDAAKKREKDWRKEGSKIYSIYRGDMPETVPFNILFSNTETLLPAIYSTVPRPVVTRRFKDDDQIGMAAAKASTRMLEFALDTNNEGYETFDEAMRFATLDGLLPGRGVTCVKYDAEIGELSTSIDDADPNNADDKKEVGEVEPTPYKESELVCPDARSWDRVYFGYAKKWSKVPWVAYFEQIDHEEAVRLFGKDIASKLRFTKPEEPEDEEDKTKRSDKDVGERKTCPIYQIWDKENKVVRYVTEQYKEGFLLVQDDPLGLTGFFNCPKPISFIEKSNDLMPVAPYKLYENQAAELNRLTSRINHVIEAIKARGVYDTELGSTIANILKQDDNVLVPTENASSLAIEKGLQNAIWMWPLEPLIQTLQQLYTARESCKQVIFEIMGLADIMRGASQASETLGAQQIKQTWGSLRLKRTQKEVQRYARDLLRMMLEVGAKKFSEDTWAKMTGLPYLTEQQVQQMQMQLQAMQQQMQMQPPQLDPNGQPLPNPMQQQMQQLQQQLQQPQWKDILALLKDDIQRTFRVDIETNSTVEPEAVEDQKNISEVMNALGQFLNGVTPLIVQGAMPFQAAQGMMLAIVRRFRFGDEIEDYIKQMQAPKPPDDGKAGQAQAEQAKLAAQGQMKDKELAQKTQSEQAANQRDVQIEQAKAAAEVQKVQAIEAGKAQLAEIEARREAAAAELDRRLKQAETTHKERVRAMELEHEADLEMRKATLQAATQLEIASMTAAQTSADNEKAEASEGVEVANTAKMMADILARQDEMMKMFAKPRTGTAKREQDGTLTLVSSVGN
jgi:hypothetical protein